MFYKNLQISINLQNSFSLWKTWGKIFTWNRYFVFRFLSQKSLLFVQDIKLRYITRISYRAAKTHIALWLGIAVFYNKDFTYYLKVFHMKQKSKLYVNYNFKDFVFVREKTSIPHCCNWLFRFMLGFLSMISSLAFTISTYI